MSESSDNQGLAINEPTDCKKVVDYFEDPKSLPTILESDKKDTFDGKSVTEPIDTRPPTWMDDNATTICILCGKEFTFIRRRHHCRCCGKVFCSDCCSQYTNLRYISNTSARVCSICYSILTVRGGFSSSVSVQLQKLPSSGGLLKKEKVSSQRRRVSFSENLETYKPVSIQNSSNDLFTVVDGDYKQHKIRINDVIDEVNNMGGSYVLSVSHHVNVRISSFTPQTIVPMDSQCDFFSFVTEGFYFHSHPELVLVVTSRNRARMGNSELVTWIIRVLQQICISVESGNSIVNHGIVVSKSPGNSSKDSGFMFVNQTFQNINVGQPSTLETLFGIYITTDEIEMAKLLPRRFLLRLYDKYRADFEDCYPCPLFSFVGRHSLPNFGDLMESVISLYTGGGEIIPTIEDLAIKRSSGGFEIILPKDKSKQVENCLDCCVGSTVFLASGSFTDQGNSYSIYNRTDQNSSDSGDVVYTFVIFCTEPGKEGNSFKEVEDGVMLYLDGDTFSILLKTLRNYENFSFKLSCETFEQVEVNWSCEKNVKLRQRTSIIDGLVMNCKNSIFTCGYANCDMINISAGYVFKLVEIVDINGNSLCQNILLKNILYILRNFINLVVKFIKVYKRGVTSLRLTLKDSDISYVIGGLHEGVLNSQLTIHDVLLQTIVGKFPNFDSVEDSQNQNLSINVDIEAIFFTSHS